MPVSELLHKIYQNALSDRPQEYIFKNEIANQLFLARHSPDSNGLMTEFRVGATRLDLVVANGTTTCYEIKTDRDELHRLHSQLTSASLVFDRIYVVTTPRYMEAACVILESFPHVGMYILGERSKLREVRSAASNVGSIQASAVFDCLRRDEYVAFLKRAFGSAPNVPNTRIYTACKEMFCTLSSAEAHKAFKGALRSRSSRKGDSADCKCVPYEARLLYLDSNPKKRKLYANSALYTQFTWG
jgi:hypothetical protein